MVNGSSKNTFFTRIALVPKKQDTLCQELASMAELYGQITGSGREHENIKVARILRHLQTLRMDVHQPFTLRLLADAVCADETGCHRNELIQVLEAISTWFTRLWCANRNPSPLSKQMIVFAHSRVPVYSTDTYGSYWVNKIGELGHTGNAVPTKKDIRNNIQERRVSGGRTWKAGESILCTINDRAYDSRLNKMEDTTLEYIIPVESVEEWINHFGDDGEEILQSYGHSFGNLALVDKEMHKVTRHLPYAEKREIYLHSHIPMTRNLAQSHRKWGEGEMIDRMYWVAEKVCEIWPWKGRSNRFQTDDERGDQA